MAEHSAVNRRVVGSSPTSGAKKSITYNILLCLSRLLEECLGFCRGSYCLTLSNSSLWIEEDGNVVGGEGVFAGGRTRPDYGLMILAGGEAALELIGDSVEAGSGVAHDEPGLTRACVASAHGAGLAGIIGGFGDTHSRLCDDASNGALLLVERKDFDGAGTVFYGVELVAACDYGDADRIDVWIEQVSAVAGGVHPEIVDDD